MEKFNVNNISNQHRQFELFGSNTNTSINFQNTNNIKIKRETLTEWRNKIHNHQLKISENSHNATYQQNILPIKEFFNENDVGIPLSMLVTLGLAELPSNAAQKFYAETLIRKSFVDLCKQLNIEWDKDWVTAQHMFDHSNNEPIPHEQQELF